jgi:hypothetical protein
MQSELNLSGFRLDHSGRCLGSFLSATSAMRHPLMVAELSFRFV